jgi:hypothetical protein
MGEQALGGAIFNDVGAQLRVSLSQLVGNQAIGSELGAGGAIATVGADSQTRLFASQVTGNVASGGVQGLGGGIYVGEGASLRSRLSLIAGNEALGVEDGEGIGGGVFVDVGSSASLRWNWIFGNWASTDGNNVVRVN